MKSVDCKGDDVLSSNEMLEKNAQGNLQTLHKGAEDGDSLAGELADNTDGALEIVAEPADYSDSDSDSSSTPVKPFPQISEVAAMENQKFTPTSPIAVQPSPPSGSLASQKSDQPQTNSEKAHSDGCLASNAQPLPQSVDHVTENNVSSSGD